MASETFILSTGMIIKHIDTAATTPQIMFFRNLFGLLLLLPLISKIGLNSLKTERMHLHLLRATVGLCGMVGLYYAWGHLPLAQAAIFRQTGPIFIPIIAFFWLQERLTVTIIIALALGFLGAITVIISKQQQTDINQLYQYNSAVLIALAGAFCGSFIRVVIRNMRTTEPAHRIVFYFAFYGVFLTAIPAFYWWQSLSLQTYLWIALIALCSTLSQWLLSQAYGYAKAGQLALFTYSSVIFASILGWLLWNEKLSWSVLIGIGLISTAGIIALRYQQKAGVAPIKHVNH